MKKTRFQWAVVGAGPAGILAVGKLLDSGVSSDEIAWIDPSFTVGALGKYWHAVSSNTKVVLFERFLQNAEAFEYSHCPHQLKHLDPNATCLLSETVKPLQWVTEQLLQQVGSFKTQVNTIGRCSFGWQVGLSNQSLHAKNLILATGAKEKHLPSDSIPCLDMPTALNPQLLARAVKAGETIAVYGASHSAVLVVKNLLELGCSVINLYKHPLKYAIYQEDHIIYDNTGLKGTAAEFARAQMETTLHPNLIRCHVDDTQANGLLSKASKAVYAIGFQMAETLSVEGINLSEYDPHTGILAAGLYGFGIAFPEQLTDRYGIQEWSVGLFKFAKYLDRVLPLWLAYGFAD